MTNVLFLCGKNRWRSPTAEAVFADRPDLEVQSAGVSKDADLLVTAEMVSWADLIFVMETTHREKLAARLGEHIKDQRVICLNIRDEYKHMDPELIELLQQRVTPHLN
ncbi:MAG: phosphotyrosine protein phosphatase [Planctomycetota bacterium]